jgi:hypothetical protein
MCKNWMLIASFATVFGLSSWAPAAAAAIPPGSYQGSCSQITVQGTTLNATCTDKNGVGRAASLPGFARCKGVIQNNDGRLQCTALPRGSYLQTCNQIVVSGTTLQATCRDSAGAWPLSTLLSYNRCTNGIENNAGTLQCTPAAVGARTTADSYAATCKNAAVSVAALTAVCQSWNGSWRSTSLANYERCPGDVENNDGQLQCSAFPRGSYQATCNSVSVSGTTLIAECQTAAGDWVATSLRHFARCGGQIENNDGRLACPGNRGTAKTPR